MANPLVRERPARGDKDTVDGFLRALQQLARTAPGVRALPRSTIARLIEPSELASKLSAVKAVLQSLETANTNPNLPAQREAATAHMRALVEQGALLPSAAFAQKLGVTRQALSKAVAARRLFFVELGAERYFPAFFLDLKYERRQVERISKSLGELPGATKLQFFMTKKASLGGQTPLQALAKGKFSGVRTTATGFAER